MSDVTRNRLGLRELPRALHRRAMDGRPHDAEQAAESVLDCFKRAVRQELELLELECRHAPN